MAIQIQTPGVHHLALRSTNLERSRQFYQDTLGFPVALDLPGLFIFVAGGTFIAVIGPGEKPGNTTFNPFTVGLDHLALGCTDAVELQRVTEELTKAGIENTGVKVDEVLGKNYVAFKDPDGIKLEYYMV